MKTRLITLLACAVMAQEVVGQDKTIPLVGLRNSYGNTKGELVMTKEPGVYQYRAVEGSIEEHTHIQPPNVPYHNGDTPSPVSDVRVIKLPMRMYSLVVIDANRYPNLSEIHIPIDASIGSIWRNLWSYGNSKTMISLLTSDIKGPPYPSLTVHAPAWLNGRISHHGWHCGYKDENGILIEDEFSGYDYTQFYYWFYWQSKDLKKWEIVDFFDLVSNRKQPGFQMFYKPAKQPYIVHRKDRSLNSCRAGILLPGIATNKVSEIPSIVIN